MNHLVWFPALKKYFFAPFESEKKSLAFDSPNFRLSLSIGNIVIYYKEGKSDTFIENLPDNDVPSIVEIKNGMFYVSCIGHVGFIISVSLGVPGWWKLTICWPVRSGTQILAPVGMPWFNLVTFPFQIICWFSKLYTFFFYK